LFSLLLAYFWPLREFYASEREQEKDINPPAFDGRWLVFSVFGPKKLTDPMWLKDVNWASVICAFER
jgi:hypothetical protein